MENAFTGLPQRRKAELTKRRFIRVPRNFLRYPPEFKSLSMICERKDTNNRDDDRVFSLVGRSGVTHAIYFENDSRARALTT